MRSMWKGSVSFGLVNIPVRMYAATEEKRVRFNQLHTLCHHRINYERVCPYCEKSVDPSEIIRGFQYDKDRYVTITDEEWARFSEQATKTIDIIRFVKLVEIDPVYFNKTYYLEPAQAGGKAYLLLREALFKAGKIAVAKITIRTRSSLAVLRVLGKVLALETVFYPDEIRDASRLNVSEDVSLQAREMEIALSLIDSLTEPFRPEEYTDEKREALLEFIEQKMLGEDPTAAPAAREELPAVDLVAALEASLKAQKETHGEIQH